MSFSIQGSSLCFDGKIIFTAPGPITDSVTDAFQDRAAIVYDARKAAPDGGRELNNPPMNDPDLMELVNRNVFLIGKEGNIIWRIQTHDEKPCPYDYVVKREDGWYAYLGEGYLYKLDIETGQTYAPVYTK